MILVWLAGWRPPASYRKPQIIPITGQTGRIVKDPGKFPPLPRLPRSPYQAGQPGTASMRGLTCPYDVTVTARDTVIRPHGPEPGRSRHRSAVITKRS